MGLVLHRMLAVILVISLMVTTVFHPVLVVIMEGDFILLTTFGQGEMVVTNKGLIIQGLVILGNHGLVILLTDLNKFQSVKSALEGVILLVHVSTEMIIVMVRLFKNVRFMENGSYRT